MTPLKIALVGVLGIGVAASLAFADHKPNHNPGGGSAAPPVYAIFDNDPLGSKQVGQMLGLGQIVLSVTTLAGDIRQVILGVESTRIPLQGRLFFTGDGCTGTAYIKREPSFGTPAINFSEYEATVFQEDLPNAPHVLYVAGTDVAVSEDINSWVDGSAVCSNDPPVSNIQGLLAEVADADLHNTYPPPYFIRPM